MDKKPPLIEGSYWVSGERQPIFNNWRNAIPLVALIAVRAFWVYVTRFNH